MLSSVIKKSRKKSAIWAHYDEMNVSNRAKCVYCSLPISYSGGSSGNLKRHLRLKHPEIREVSLRQDYDDDCCNKSMKIDDLEAIPEADAAVFEITEVAHEDSDLEETGIISSKESSVKPSVSPSHTKSVAKRVIFEKPRTTATAAGESSKSATSRSLPSSSASRKHEYDFFGEYVSSALKTLPPENAIAALAEIMEVISREKMSALVNFPSK